MRFGVLATDYDGTLAEAGSVSSAALRALEEVRRSGRRLVLVTGRELDDLMRVFAHLELFDAVVAENGALLYTPTPPLERPLASPPPAAFVTALRALGVPVSAGRIIVATTREYEGVVRRVIRARAPDLSVITNRDALMVLPRGVDKGTGLAAALAEIGAEREEVIGVGDAENDHALLDASALGVAVANAEPSLKARADFVTRAPRGRGVVDLVAKLVAMGRPDARGAPASAPGPRT